MARSTTKSSNNSSNNSSNRATTATTATAGSQQPTAHSQRPTRAIAPERTQGGLEPETFWIWGGFGDRGACACACACGLRGGGAFRRIKRAPERHYQLQLELSKQKQSTDKQFTVKPHFTRHAGKAGGYHHIPSCLYCMYITFQTCCIELHVVLDFV